MPSVSFQDFCENLVDVDRLIKAHGILSSRDRGKRGLGHITRSAVVMLCATWEIFLEDLIREAVKILSKHCLIPKDLPLLVQKELSRSVRNAKHELRPLDLAGDGWKIVYRQHTEVTLSHFNTPKIGPIGELMKKFIGIEIIESIPEDMRKRIDEFVNARGEIAHKGRKAKYIRINQLRKYRIDVIRAAVKIDNLVRDFLRSQLNLQQNQPWKAIEGTEIKCGELEEGVSIT